MWRCQHAVAWRLLPASISLGTQTSIALSWSAWLTRAWKRVADLGTEGLPLEEERKIRALNQFVLIASSSVAMYGSGFLLDAKHYAFGVALDFSVALTQLLGLVWAKRGYYTLAVGQFLFLCNGQLGAASYYAGPGVGFHYYFFAFAAVVFLVVPRRMWFFYPFVLVSTSLFFYFAFVMDANSAVVEIDPLWALMVRAMTIAATFATLALIVFLFDRDTREAEQKLALEHERSERLLLNILPRSISDRLKTGEKSIADGFAEVSVVFADIVGFTELSSKLPPAELVQVLNEVFSKFDELAEKFGLEKIKTIGDAYMVASGLPVPRADHAVAATRMAIEMRIALDEVNAKYNQHLEVRIGIHSGPVVAGVIGKKKFIYDLWGDTVNIASRMESHGIKGLVHVSSVTADLIRGSFDLESRGNIKVKGKGEMETFLVTGPRE